MARGGPAHAAQAAAYRPARARTARGGIRLRGQLFVGAALGQAMAATPPGRGRGIRRAGMGAGQRAGRFRPGPGRGRGRGTDRAFPRGLVLVLEHAVRGRAARRDRGMRVPWPEQGVLPHRNGPPRAGVRQRHRGRPPQGRRDRHPDEAVLAVLRALRLRDEVLQPVFRAREGQHGERGRLPAPQPDGADAVRGGMGPAHRRVAGTLRRDRPRRPLPRGRADPRPVRDGPRPHAPASAVHVRRVRLARREGRQDRNRHDRLEPLSRGVEMAFHASHGRRAGPAGRAAFHGRRANRHAGTQVGTLPRHRDGPALAARHHRAQAAFVGRESHTLRFSGGDARAARPDGAARTRPAGGRYPPRGRGEWLPRGRHGRRRDRRRGQKARQGRDRPDGQADRAGRRSRVEGQARHVQQVHEGGRR